MLNSCKNSVKILKIACIHAGMVANEGITKNALLDQKTMYFFHTGKIIILLAVMILALLYCRMTSGSLRILTSFAEDYISKIEALKSEWNVDQILERDFEKRRHGFHLAMQIVMAAYNELIEAKEVIPLQVHLKR